MPDEGRADLETQSRHHAREGSSSNQPVNYFVTVAMTPCREVSLRLTRARTIEPVRRANSGLYHSSATCGAAFQGKIFDACRRR